MHFFILDREGWWSSIAISFPLPIRAEMASKKDTLLFLLREDSLPVSFSYFIGFGVLTFRHRSTNPRGIRMITISWKGSVNSSIRGSSRVRIYVHGTLRWERNSSMSLLLAFKAFEAFNLSILSRVK